MLDQIYSALDTVLLDAVVFLVCTAGAIYSFRRDKEGDVEGRRYLIFFLLLIAARALQAVRRTLIPETFFSFVSSLLIVLLIISALGMIFLKKKHQK